MMPAGHPVGAGQVRSTWASHAQGVAAVAKAQEAAANRARMVSAFPEAIDFFGLVRERFEARLTYLEIQGERVRSVDPALQAEAEARRYMLSFGTKAAERRLRHMTPAELRALGEWVISERSARGIDAGEVAAPVTPPLCPEFGNFSC